jgi:redox-sensitive bicupin YhaK (pirin superfamily)
MKNGDLVQTNGAVKRFLTLGFPWETADPFLFLVHHDDHYPAGNDKLGPKASLKGRDIGNDFAGIDGWRMYHGDTVPGFPQHPHRGFETVTVVRKGVIDHSDSLGATARFSGGDAQWLTAGKGISHAEMFPLINENDPNPTDFFQIWLNLPKAGKMVAPYFSMQWGEKVPKVSFKDPQGRVTEVTLVAGELAGQKALPPPPDSWASHPDSDLAIWTIKMAPGAKWALPKAKKGTNRTIYFFKGDSIQVGGTKVKNRQGVELVPDVEVLLENGESEGELLLLQGRPIGEPVAKYGPFVMNTMQEIQQAFEDYQRTQFGGWPWKADDPVHARTETRFAKRPDGKVERPTS